MTDAVLGRDREFGPGDYDTVERAVMETPRGRWFLAERDQRRQGGETQRILDALKKLEASLQTFRPQPSSSAEISAQTLSPRNLKYSRKDEAIFVPTGPAVPRLSGIAALEPPPQAAEPPQAARGARLIVSRVGAAGPVAGAAPEAGHREAEIPPAAVAGEKRRIVIIRRAATELMDIPLPADLPATSAMSVPP